MPTLIDVLIDVSAVAVQDVGVPMFVSDSDFIDITKNGELCNERKNLGPAQFEAVMREQLQLYMQARLSSTSELWNATDDEFTELGTLKQILLEQARVARLLERIVKENEAAAAGGAGGGGNSPSPSPTSSRSTVALRLKKQDSEGALDGGTSEEAGSPVHSRAAPPPPRTGAGGGLRGGGEEAACA